MIWWFKRGVAAGEVDKFASVEIRTTENLHRAVGKTDDIRSAGNDAGDGRSAPFLCQKTGASFL